MATRILSPLAIAAFLCVSPVAQAQSVTVAFDDPGGTYSSYYDAISSATVAAGRQWLDTFESVATASIDVLIGFDLNIQTASGRNIAGLLSPSGFMDSGAGIELRTGTDINGDVPDAQFNFGVGASRYLQDELWFGTGDVPLAKTDGQSVLLHEFGHAFGFNGFRDYSTGISPFGDLSVFDSHMSADALGQWFFTGDTAGAVALTAGNFYHYNALGLMNGVSFDRGTQYAIGALDRAIFTDLGFILAGTGGGDAVAPIPEPETYALLMAGLGVVGFVARRRGERS